MVFTTEIKRALECNMWGELQETKEIQEPPPGNFV